MDGADWDEVQRQEGAADPDFLDLNCALLRLTIAVSMAHI